MNNFIIDKDLFKVMKYEGDEIIVFKPKKNVSEGAKLILERTFPKPYKDELINLNSVRKRQHFHRYDLNLILKRNP